MPASAVDSALQVGVAVPFVDVGQALAVPLIVAVEAAVETEVVESRRLPWEKASAAATSVQV